MNYNELTELEKAVHHLLWVWVQYGGANRTEDGRVFLNHRDMIVGEQAGEWLQKHGYAECGGGSDVVTEKGIKLMEVEYTWA